jgi:hypothetical protein
MCGHRAKTRACLFLAVAWLAGCMSQPEVPVTWPLPSAQDAVLDIHGSWIRLFEAEEIEGELIAIELPRIWILGEKGIRTVADASAITMAELILYKNNAGSIGLWSALGLLSSLTHGFFAVISGPICLVGGISISSYESADGWLTFPRRNTFGNLAIDWAEIAKFARFPQGLPKDLDVSLLKPKHHPEKRVDRSGARGYL